MAEWNCVHRSGLESYQGIMPTVQMPPTNTNNHVARRDNRADTSPILIPFRHDGRALFDNTIILYDREPTVAAVAAAAAETTGHVCESKREYCRTAMEDAVHGSTIEKIALMREGASPPARPRHSGGTWRWNV
jgi:hypothetical protein